MAVLTGPFTEPASYSREVTLSVNVESIRNQKDCHLNALRPWVNQSQNLFLHL